MNTRILLNIFLLVLMLTLAGVAIWHNDDSSYLKLKLTSLTRSDINKITITRNNGDIILAKTSSGWMMLSPYTTTANDFRVNQLLNLTQTIAENSYDITDLELSQFNLEPSDTKIIFNNTLLEFGKSNPVNLLRYIKIDNRLYLAKENVYPLLRSQPSSFVSLNLLPDVTSIKSIQLPDFHLTNESGKQWVMSPQQDFNQDQLQNFLQNWKSASAFAVHAYMERKQLGEIRIQTNNSAIKFEITDNDPWLILARKDTNLEYHFDKSQVDRLLKITDDTDPQLSSK
ncbi:MAG: DUF4340 domain-containing protein [Gammaproteobacteria bacterium]|nr:DUF4340 domain-containing protein [Gammaproteobacteria bacterium]